MSIEEGNFGVNKNTIVASTAFQEAMKSIALPEGSQIAYNTQLTFNEEGSPHQTVNLVGRYLTKPPSRSGFGSVSGANMPMVVAEQTTLATSDLSLESMSEVHTLDHIAEHVPDNHLLATLRPYRDGGLASISSIAFVPIIDGDSAFGYFDMTTWGDRYAVLIANNGVPMSSMRVVGAGQNSLGHIEDKEQRYLEFQGISGVSDEELFATGSLRGVFDFIILPVQPPSQESSKPELQKVSYNELKYQEPSQENVLSSGGTRSIRMEEVVAKDSRVKQSDLSATRVMANKAKQPLHMRIKVIAVSVINGTVELSNIPLLN